MSITTSNQLHKQDALRQLAQDLESAKHGTKGAIKKAFMESYDCSLQTLHRWLEGVGWSSDRKTRADAGKTSQSEDVLVELGAMLKEGLRRNGKQTMHITTARSILKQSGRDIDVSNNRLATLLRQMNMDMKRQKMPTAKQSIVSLYPNHMHQADPSLCLLYYTPNGQQKVLRDDEIYKNKPGWVEKVGNLKCWRYVLTDHYSGTIIVKYYQARGETQDNMYDFLLYCWDKTKGRCFNGAPKILYTDPGTAHTAGGMQNALKSLNIQFEAHKAGVAWATGSVEGAQNIVETQFESRLLYHPVDSVEALNVFAEWWYNAYNSNTIPEYDSRLNRRGMAKPLARYEIWQTIRQQHLNILPPLELCRYLMVNDPIERPVYKELEVSFKFPGDNKVTYWDVAHIPGLMVGQKITVQPLIMTRSDDSGKQILISIKDFKGNETTYTAAPVDFDRTSGIKQSGAIAGEEYISMPHSDADVAATRMARAAYPDMHLDEIEKQRKKNAVPLQDINSLDHLKDIETPTYMDKRGEQIDVPNRVQIEVKPMDSIDIAMTLKRKHGVKMDMEKNLLIKKWYPDGVFEDELEAIAQRLTSQPALRVVNSGAP